MAKKNEQKDVLFVKVPDSKNLRVRILESSKDILESLKKYENYKKTKDEKKALVEEVRSLLKEVAKLSGQARTMMPKVEIKEPVKPKKKEVKIEVPKPIKIKPRQLSEIEKLEKELGEIEAKIQSI